MPRLPFLLAVVLAATALVPFADARAQSPKTMRGQVEASMLVTGDIEIDTAGGVSAFTLDRPEALPVEVRNLVARAMPTFLFEPIVQDGKPVRARAKMSALVVATPVDDDNMRIAIRSTHFGEQPRTGPHASPDAVDSEEARDARAADTSQVRADVMAPPHYPLQAAEIGGQGIVYLVLKIGRDGRVEDLVAELVNLTVVGSGEEVRMIRKSLSKAAMVAARDWTFLPPTTGDAANATSWNIRVPVAFSLKRPGEDRTPYGEWEAYLPGPLSRPSWLKPDLPGFSPDAMVAGVHDANSRFRLRSAPDGG